MSEKPSAKGGSLRSDVYFLFLGWSLGGYTKEHDKELRRQENTSSQENQEINRA